MKTELTFPNTTIPPAPSGLPGLTDQELQSLALLNAHHGLDELGEGDLAVGINVMAACALTLANIAPFGSTLEDQDFKMNVGLDTLVTGAFSCNLIEEAVIDQMRQIQANVISHCRNYLLTSKKDEVKSSTLPFDSQKPNAVPASVLRALEDDKYRMMATCNDPWQLLLASPANSSLDDVTRKPIIFATVGSPGQVATVQRSAHGGRALMHARLGAPSEAHGMQLILSAMQSGHNIDDMPANPGKSAMIVTDPHGHIEELLAAQPGLSWCRDMLWLSDHNLGPSMDTPSAHANQVAPRRMRQWFVGAMKETAAHRYNINSSVPILHKSTFAKEHTEWLAFLRTLEPHCPGITGTLRPLYASLLFGMTSMRKLLPVGESFSLYHEGYLSLCKLLALRMLRLREHILGQSRCKELQALTASLRLKLGDGPQQVRDLIRRYNRLDANTCREALERLALSGIAKREGKFWFLADSANSQITPNEQPQTTTIDV
jgi:hypothetical protein